MEYRVERDTMGPVQVPADRYWGAQTQRSYENFKIGQERMPRQVIQAFGVLKKAAALSNAKLGMLDDRRAEAIAAVCDEILRGELDGHFPLVVWQTGSGTQTNMNVNEVVANRANELLGETLVHPNDHVNKSQSSNDTFPTAMHIAARLALEEQLIPALDRLETTLMELSRRYWDLVKIGRTHLQDATPLTLGQEISAWAAMLKKCRRMVEFSCSQLEELALGGTAALRLRAHRNFRLEDNAARPLILIGNGTGIAGLRSHLRARVAAGAGPHWLLFGERNAAHDFLYQDEIEAWQTSGLLQRLDLAFSRDQAERIYVQHRLTEAAGTLLEWVERGAAIYVCGSLQGMAQGVDDALAAALGREQVAQLLRSGRYRRDVY